MRRIQKRPCNIPGFSCFHYCCIVYIEDLEKNGTNYAGLIGFLAGLHVQCACSPIHDQDTWTAEDVWSYCEAHLDPETGDLSEDFLDDAPFVGKPKKPHVHLMFCNQKKTTVDEMQELFSLMELRPTIWEKCKRPSSYARYFVHMDDPDKYPYNVYDIHGFGGIKLDDMLADTSKARQHEMKVIVFEMIREKKIKYLNQLIDIARGFGDYEIEACIFGNQQLFSAYLRERRYQWADEREAKRRKEEREKVLRDGLIG